MTAKLKIIKDTLGNSFDYDNYLNFIINFLKKPNLFYKNRDVRIWKEYLTSIEAYYKIGDYRDDEGSEILILAVELKRGSTVERARSLQRNFISKILDGSSYEAAIVAFYTPGEENWRLSFVKLDYKLTEKGLELDLTPARRFSYLVGKNEPTHTAQKRLLTLIEEDSKNPSLDEIEEVFSVEKVTDDFFKHYKEKYLELKEYLESSSDFIEETEKLGLDVENFSEQFSKKLMGQISFLYFLQKKGWLGVTLLPKKRILSLSEYSDISQNLKPRELEILNRVFLLRADLNVYCMDMEEYKALSDKEVEGLGQCFKNTKFDMAWGTGEKQFIRGLFDFCEENTSLNFFDEYLEPFFYEALNKERKNSYYKRFNCKIPFLNGGLFEPLEGYHWEDVDFKIPNEIFSNRRQKGEYADGILDIFDRYNFTINEAEPLEKEVAVDPEMLGKVFENLLDVDSRKSKGAFYTPREIVHFMCQETLANYIANEVKIPYEDVKKFILYGELMRDQDNTKEAEGKREYIIPESIYKNLLEIDRALDNVRVADPAVGSGAFPLGMLTEIVSAKDNITEYIIKKDREVIFDKRLGEDFIRSRRSSYKIKWETIRDCIYAVDIEASAVDITKLRLWLSLVVDQELEGNEDPHPLPNLDMNIHVGNSLVDEYEGIELFDKDILKKKDRPKKTDDSEQLKMLFSSDEILEDMFRKQVEYFKEFDESRKKSLKAGIDSLREQLIFKRLKEEGNIEALEKYEEIKDNKSQPFFIWELEFAKVFKEKGGFDIVIGNPPYVGEKGNRKLFDEIKKTNFGKLYQSGRMDLFYYFYHKGIDIGNDKLEISFITTNYFKTADSAYKLRYDLRKRVNVRRIIDFNEFKIFESALGQHNLILIATKNSVNKVETYIYDNNYTDKNHTEVLSNLASGNYNCFKNNSFELEKLYDGKNMYIRLHGVNINESENPLNNVLNKIAKNKVLLGDICNINQGIVSGCDSISRRNIKKIQDLNTLKQIELKDAIFVFDLKNKRDCQVIETFNIEERKYLRKFYKNSDVHQYYSNTKYSKYILYTNNINKIENYRNIEKHMNLFKPILEDRREVQKGTRDYYDLQWPRSENIFIGKKIVAPQRSYKNTFAYNSCEWFASADVYFITEKTNQFSLKYLLALLNSKTYYMWLYYRGKRKGNMLELYKTPLEEIPIPKVSLEYEELFIDLIDRIYAEIEMNGYEDNKNIEILSDKIEEKIYELYKFTECEVEVIESHYKNMCRA